MRPSEVFRPSVYAATPTVSTPETIQNKTQEIPRIREAVLDFARRLNQRRAKNTAVSNANAVAPRTPQYREEGGPEARQATPMTVPMLSNLVAWAESQSQRTDRPLYPTRLAVIAEPLIARLMAPQEQR